MRILFVFLLSLSLYAKKKEVKEVKLSDLVDQVDSRCKVIKNKSRKLECLKAFKKSYKKKLVKFINKHYKDPAIKKEVMINALNNLEKVKY